VVEHENLHGVDVTRLLFPLPSARASAAIRFAASTPAAATALVRYVRQVRPDVIHVIGAGPQAVYISALAPLFRTRIIFTAQGELTFDAHDVFRKSVVLRAGLRRMLRVAGAVTACSAYVLESLPLPRRLGRPHVVVPNGVDPSEFGFAVSPRGRPYVLSVGRLVSQKGFDVLIRAFALADLKGLDLVIAGDGPERGALSTLARALGVERRVTLLGTVPRDRVPGLITGAEMFALPSRGEPFGIALLEAMAAGVPSVATHAGGIVDFARDGDNALLVSVDDVPGLKNALTRLHSDSSLRARLSTSGRETADLLSWERIAPSYERLYVSR
jgi:glycogen synthase